MELYDDFLHEFADREAESEERGPFTIRLSPDTVGALDALSAEFKTSRARLGAWFLERALEDFHAQRVATAIREKKASKGRSA